MNNFFLKVFKDPGLTSLDVVRKIKKQLLVKKIGHIGTLDPFASGLLLIAVGKTTKLNDYIHNKFSKTYLATGKLGISTDSGDITGSITSLDNSNYFKNLKLLNAKTIESKLNDKFLGSYEQAPHMFSAAKFMGKKLYQYAREGIIIPKAKVTRTIFKIEVVKFVFPYLSIRFTVSSGTYIRSLFSECVNYLGTLGTLIGLTRESIGNITMPNRNYDLTPLPPDHILNYPSLILDSLFLASKFTNGQFINHSAENGLYWVYHSDSILGLGKVENSILKVEVNFS